MKLSGLPGHFKTLRNGFQFVATARKIGFSERRARSLGKVLQIVRSPREYLVRKRMARRLLEETTPPFTVGDGYVRFTAADLPSGLGALSVCQEIAEEEKASYRAEENGKGFLRSLLTPERLRERPELLAFATSREMIAVVSEYLGTVPTLSDLRLWWSVPPSTPQEPSSSQKFHRDHEDTRQVKVFLNIEEVTDDGGPFTFLPASKSADIAVKIGSAFGRFDDSDVLTHTTPDVLVILKGPAGDAAMVDTCSCLHYGSRNDKTERLLLMLHYVGYHSTFEPDSKILTDEVRAEWQGGRKDIAALMRTRPPGI
jgi:hypothetical protein